MLYNLKQLDKTHLLVELEDGFYFKIKNKEWEQFDIGLDMSESQYDLFYKEYGVKKCRFKAIDLLSRSDKCEQELKRKLIENHFHPNVVEEIIEFLKEKKYIDDEAYVSNYILYKSDKKSKAQIINALRMKGIATNIIESVFSNNYSIDKEKDIVRKGLKKMQYNDSNSELDINKFKMKMLRMGIEMGTINSVLNEEL